MSPGIKLVRPSIGHPFITTVDGLKAFEITFAGNGHPPSDEEVEQMVKRTRMIGYHEDENTYNERLVFIRVNKRIHYRLSIGQILDATNGTIRSSIDKIANCLNTTLENADELAYFYQLAVQYGSPTSGPGPSGVYTPFGGNTLNSLNHFKAFITSVRQRVLSGHYNWDITHWLKKLGYADLPVEKIPEHYVDIFTDGSMPQSSEDHKVWAGFRWEYLVLAEAPETTPLQHIQFPTMFRLSFDDRQQHNAICVRPSELGEKFNFIHITDLHIAARFDVMRDTLSEDLQDWEKELFVSRLKNPNTNFSAFIEYANELTIRNQLDFIVATGDLVDHVYDGYFGKRGKYQYGHHNQAVELQPDNRSNFHQFIRLIVPPDGNDGARLRAPIYCIPGNHDYLLYEPLSAVNIDLAESVNNQHYVAVFFGKILSGENIADLLADALLESKPEINFKIDRFGGMGLTHFEAIMYELWKKGNDAVFRNLYAEYRQKGSNYYEYGNVAALSSKPEDYEEKQSLAELRRYVSQYNLPAIKRAFAIYTEHINFDTDFFVPLGDNALVFLNTGYDVHIPTERDIVDNGGDYDKLPRFKNHFINDYPHNRGFIPAHQTLTEAADLYRKTGQGSIFLFNHAPFFSTKGSFFPSYHTIEIPQKDVTKVLKAADLDYHIADGFFDQLLTGKNGRRFFYNFAGHTHYAFESSLKAIPKPGKETTYTFGSGFDEQQDYYHAKSPLFFLSGGQKGYYPQFRKITVDGIHLLSTEFVQKYKKEELGNGAHLMSVLCAFVTQFKPLAPYICHLSEDVFAEELKKIKAEVTTDSAAVARTRWLRVLDDLTGMFIKLQRIAGFMPVYSKQPSCPDYPVVEDVVLCRERKLQAELRFTNWKWHAINVLNAYGDKDTPRGDEEKMIAKLTAIRQGIIKNLYQLAAFPTSVSGDDFDFPQWYKSPVRFKVDTDFYQRFIGGETRLLLSMLSLWLNKFGVSPNTPYLLADQYKQIGLFDIHWCDKVLHKQVYDISCFLASDPGNLARIIFAFESASLAESNAFKFAPRNTMASRYYLNWATGQPIELLKYELINKYQLLCEHYDRHKTQEQRAQFYAQSIVRILSWNPPAKASFSYDDYHQMALQKSTTFMSRLLTARLEYLFDLLTTQH